MRLFVGDVQGCAVELDELVGRVRDRFGNDFEIWFAGDLVNRGPQNLRVLRLVRELMDSGRARAVLGNHDLSLISAHLGLRRPRPRDTFTDVLADPQADDWIGWLRRLPLAETGEIDGDGFAVVHASVHPDWTLDEVSRAARRAGERLSSSDPKDAAEFLAADPAADPERQTLARLTSARAVDDAGGFSPTLPERPVDAWHRRWQRRKHDYGVVYGHWAVQRLYVAPGLRGLDTGCVHHGRGSQGALTAWLPDLPRSSRVEGSGGVFAVPDDRFLHVLAHSRYYGDAPQESPSSAT